MDAREQKKEEKFGDIPRAVVQVSSTCKTGDGEPYVIRTALCSDGSMWTDDTWNNQWVQLPSIPPAQEATLEEMGL